MKNMWLCLLIGQQEVCRSKHLEDAEVVFDCDIDYLCQYSLKYLVFSHNTNFYKGPNLPIGVSIIEFQTKYQHWALSQKSFTAHQSQMKTHNSLNVAQIPIIVIETSRDEETGVWTARSSLSFLPKR